MTKTITLYFDFGSPFSYFAYCKLKTLAPRHEYDLILKPIILWPILQEIGMPPPSSIEAKSQYLRQDMKRTARFMGLDYTHPKSFMGSTHNAARLAHSFQLKDPAKGQQMIDCLFKGFMVDGHDIRDRDTLVKTAEMGGFSREEIGKALNDNDAKTQLQMTVAEAKDKGVYGVPFIFVDDEAFFGVDHLPQIEKWLVEGGF